MFAFHIICDLSEVGLNLIKVCREQADSVIVLPVLLVVNDAGDDVLVHVVYLLSLCNVMFFERIQGNGLLPQIKAH